MYTVLALVWTHFVADFVLQSDQMARNKHHDTKWLGLHSLTYGAPFLLFGYRYAIVATCLHYVVDMVNSKITARLYAAHETHWFFTVIGFDQALHMTILLWTANIMGGL